MPDWIPLLGAGSIPVVRSIFAVVIVAQIIHKFNAPHDGKARPATHLPQNHH